MGLKEDVEAGVKGVLAPAWERRNGQVVPETEDIALKNGAVDIDATYLYADMADSTGLAQRHKDSAVAKVIRSYLNAATRIIRYHGGAIRSFDGDRVMGIFIGDGKNSTATKAALQITWAVQSVINPALKAKWTDLQWAMKHGIGIDTGSAMLVRGGVHGQNDIVSIGSAPNIAAKLSDIRSSRSINISKAVYDKLNEKSKYSSGVDMWTKEGQKEIGGKLVTYYGSSYHWKP
ncbi:adenylate/guanylate cyclase domain-containing protein [Amycolatopsis jiangsuensis]|uniref:Class 3 adenylate cyclase n=1 Tax=Amycolatopsis jiangsuensis TaxID=1181879 RepID=A0A840J1W8_9PSEU|nr:adenylate/guanylate cyclase domain-containing protein [Amycolatopsis jiangsuensis]MBB4687398.1 class 3 adenylate cyclase [Amycolatopsis jiangsuensis]